MKINKYVEDLKAKSAAELNDELVAAKKELFNPDCNCTEECLIKACRLRYPKKGE